MYNIYKAPTNLNNQITSKLAKIWGKKINWHNSNKDFCVASRHIKVFTFYFLEMQIKLTIRYHFIAMSIPYI